MPCCDSKRCSSCGERKSLSEFGPDARCALGVKGQCRACVAAYKRKRRKINPEIAHQEGKDALRRYQKKMSGPDAAAVKEKKRKYDQEYRIRNRERLRHYERHRRVRNAEAVRAIKKSYKARRRQIERGGMSGPEMTAWQESQAKICHWCGSSCESDFHADHYVPLSKGGKHQPGNLVIACSACNLKKNAKHPAEFANSLGRIL